MPQFRRRLRAGELRADDVLVLGVAIEQQAVRPDDVLAGESAGVVGRHGVVSASYHQGQWRGPPSAAYNPQVMPNIKVMHFGLGPIGAAIVKQVAARPGFKIVGAIDIDPAKVGRDLGDVVGLPKRIGVKVSGDAAKALKSAKPDVVVLCTSSSIKKVLPQIELILKSKTAIVSTTEELSYPTTRTSDRRGRSTSWRRRRRSPCSAPASTPASRWTRCRSR